MKLNKQHPLYQEDLHNILHIKGIEQLSGKTFLITGATGLIGTCLIDALMLYNEKGANINIYAIGRNREKAKARLGEYFDSKLFAFIENDVRQPFPKEINADYILPLASNTHPLAYSQFPIETIEINVKGAEHALNKAVECGATLLYPSTVEIYGNARGKDVFTEEYTGDLNLSNARSCYTESKRVSEALCQSYIAEKDCNAKIARLCRVFGPTMLESDTKASSQFIKLAIQQKDIVLKSKGDQLFSYIYVADAVKAILHILLHGEKGVPYNISNENCNVHLKDFARICAERAERKVVFDLPTEKERQGYSIAQTAVLSNDRIKNTGFVLSYSLQDAIRRTIMIFSESI